MPTSQAAHRPRVVNRAKRRRLELELPELWPYRELAYFFVWRDLKVRYKQTLIGAGWAVIQPTLTMALFTVVFGHLAKLPSSDLPYPVFFYAGLLPWLYVSQSVQKATETLVEHQQVITKVYFPRLILPLSAVMSGLVDLAIAFVVLGVLMVVFQVTPSIFIFMVPLFLALGVATALGVGLWLSALHALYRDVRQVVTFSIQVWLFASPVVYSSSLIPQRWEWLYGLNPMAGVIEGFRWSLTSHGQPPGLMTMISALAVIALLVSGAWFFKRVEATVADVV